MRGLRRETVRAREAAETPRRFSVDVTGRKGCRGRLVCTGLVSGVWKSKMEDQRLCLEDLRKSEGVFVAWLPV